MKYYIAYGSNLDVGQMAYRCPDAKVVGRAVLKGWSLVFNGVATIVPKEDSIVPVGVWSISDRDEANLDRYEGYPRLYRKEMFVLKLKDADGNEKFEDAIVYVMNAGRRDRMPPSNVYYNTIKRGYKEFGLDVNILNQAVDDSVVKGSK